MNRNTQQITKNFQYWEVACHCGCGLTNIDHQLMRVAQILRGLVFMAPVAIGSGCRCKFHNEYGIGFWADSSSGTRLRDQGEPMKILVEKHLILEAGPIDNQLVVAIKSSSVAASGFLGFPFPYTWRRTSAKESQHIASESTPGRALDIKPEFVSNDITGAGIHDIIKNYESESGVRLPLSTIIEYDSFIHIDNRVRSDGSRCSWNIHDPSNVTTEFMRPGQQGLIL